MFHHVIVKQTRQVVRITEKYIIESFKLFFFVVRNLIPKSFACCLLSWRLAIFEDRIRAFHNVSAFVSSDFN